MKNKYLLLITTSHKPSPRTRSFVKDLANTLPSSLRVTRGKKTLVEIGLEAYRFKTRYVFIVNEKRGNPSSIRVYGADYLGKMPRLKHTHTIILGGVKLTRENPESTRAYNPETININYDRCETDKCYKLADLLASIYHEILSDKPDIEIELIEKNYVFFKPLNRLGKICGPILKIKDVKTIV
ncbi:MAG: hypothetical protein B6U89_03450 [Desulfurococcales archaeon ex4484_58]|nr:MAG: hypothetical protein B6U89_03450 [Desulfurococcales archaeon ex4484_58]